MYKNRIFNCIIIKSNTVNSVFKNILSSIFLSTFSTFSNFKNIFITKKNIDSDCNLKKNIYDNYEPIILKNKINNNMNEDWGWFVSFD